MKIWRDWYEVESDRFINTDVLRFVASAGIVIYHYLPHVLDIGSYTRPWRLVFFNLNAFVDVFFIISGYVIHSVYTGRITDLGSYARFIRNRIARLLPLHYVTLLFYLLIMGFSLLAGLALSDDNYDIKCLPAQLTLTHAWGFCPVITFNGPSWSISAEMAAYLLAPLLFVVAKRGYLVGLVLVASFVFGYHFADQWHLPRLHQRTADFGILRAIPAFLYGAWLSARPERRWLAPLARMPLVPVLVIYLLAPLVLDSAWMRFALAYWLATVAFARDAQATPSAGLRRFAPLGRLTYSLYMLHLPVATVFLSLAAERVLHLEGSLKAAAVAGTGIIVLPIVSILSLQLFEMPARKRLSARTRRADQILASETAA